MSICCNSQNSTWENQVSIGNLIDFSQINKINVHRLSNISQSVSILNSVSLLIFITRNICFDLLNCSSSPVLWLLLSSRCQQRQC